MRGSIKQRYAGTWSIILQDGYEPHPTEPGKRRRRQTWITFYGSRKQALDKLADLLSDANHGLYVEPSKVTLGQWLDKWVEASVKPRCRPSTYDRYRGIIDRDLVMASLGNMLVQRLRPIDIESYFADARAAEKPLSASTLNLHHTILYSALKKAKKDKLVAINAAEDLDGKPKRTKNRGTEARQHAWTATEARAFLVVAKAAGAQPAAFYSLALDTGARKGELCGLKWIDVDLVAGRVVVARTLITAGPEPVFGPTKTGTTRTIAIGPGIVELLKAHKQHQSAVKMLHRPTYRDLGLVFAKESADECGLPLQINNLGQREYAGLIAAAGVRTIKFHGLRHTCATLLLQARIPVHVVSERLGHAKVSMTMEVYAHVLPDMQHEAATAIGGLLHGNG